MVPILQTFSNAIFVKENFGCIIEISLKFVHNGLINNRPAFVQTMAWRGETTDNHLNQ